MGNFVKNLISGKSLMGAAIGLVAALLLGVSPLLGAAAGMGIGTLLTTMGGGTQGLGQAFTGAPGGAAAPHEQGPQVTPDAPAAHPGHIPRPPGGPGPGR